MLSPVVMVVMFRRCTAPSVVPVSWPLTITEPCRLTRSLARSPGSMNTRDTADSDAGRDEDD